MMRITLCGSTRFVPLFHEWNHKLAVAGHTVYSLSLFGREAKDAGKDDKKIVTEEEKIVLDLVHLDKILNSDASREIRWARMQRKYVYWIENAPDPSESTRFLL